MSALTEDEARLRDGRGFYDSEPEDEVGYEAVEF